MVTWSMMKQDRVPWRMYGEAAAHQLGSANITSPIFTRRDIPNQTPDRSRVYSPSRTASSTSGIVRTLAPALCPSLQQLQATRLSAVVAQAESPFHARPTVDSRA
jgi:hypothetical protein